MQNHASSDRQYLHVIKASAGSGKTHRLTGEYLRLLFSKQNNYKHILAVTFTNKATDEMKSRIVEELHRLSSGSNSDYLSSLMEEFSLTESRVRTQAKTILETILHDYSAFSINTIDRFFQQTMRVFTRETGLSGGYNIEVDETPVLLEAIDLMLSELDKPENKILSGWLLMFMQDQIENGKSWKIDRQVQDLAKELFNEKYKSVPEDEQEKIRDKEYLETYKRTLIKIVKSFENELKAIGEKGVNLMDRFGLHYSEFKGGRNSAFSHFVKWANSEIKEPTATFAGLPDSIEAWYTKTTPPDKKPAIESVYSEGLNDLVKQAVRHFENDLFYKSAKSILNYFYTLGILNDIQRRLRELQQEKNILFLSDTTELLNEIISGSDSPFIYEKTGTHLTNYMIDEFQDTSKMQWENFYPLMKESLSANNFNLIVGDVKQSIYRWRNSDWRLLEEQVTRDFSPGNVQQHVLDTNWRSDARIIQFNNAFFTLAAQRLQQDFNRITEPLPETGFTQYTATKIKDAYAHVYQHIPEKKNIPEGLVNITFLNDEDKENDWKSQALERLPKEIEALQDQGFALKDIAIVVRWNNEAVEVAETLLNYKGTHPDSPYRYDMISNEALVIGNAQSVKAVIALLRYFRNRKDDTKKMLALYEFYRFHRKLSPDAALAAYRTEAADDFPQEIKPQLNEIASLPLYEMIEAFFALSTDVLDEKENAYVQAFLDISLQFSSGTSSDLNDFLDWWDEKGHKKTLFSPDNQDAIRLITIHKSKGLGFGAVIMPFIHWTVDHNPVHNDIIWCSPSLEPFNALSIVPVRYSSGLINTIFREDYLEEKLYTYIDHLNLLYVAFTRAKHRLIGFAPKPKKEDSLRFVSELLWTSISAAGQSSMTSSVDKSFISLNDYLHHDENESVFCLGEATKRIVPQENIISRPYGTGKWQSTPFSNRLKIRLNNTGFFSDNGNRDYGTLMHEIVSRVETMADIRNAVGQKVSDGELDADKKKETTEELLRFLSISEVADWYSGKYRILNETQVLHQKAGFSRPDRIMIGNDRVIVVDYKFGEAEESKYIRQVRYYMQRIQEMGYENISGYIFYVKLGKIVQV